MFAPEDREESRCVECVKTCRGEWYGRRRYDARTITAEVYKDLEQSLVSVTVDRAQFLYPFKNWSGKVSNPDKYNLGIFTTLQSCES